VNGWPVGPKGEFGECRRILRVAEPPKLCRELFSPSGSVQSVWLVLGVGSERPERSLRS
jgi:hypothetical protein